MKRNEESLISKGEKITRASNSPKTPNKPLKRNPTFSHTKSKRGRTHFCFLLFSVFSDLNVVVPPFLSLAQNPDHLNKSNKLGMGLDPNGSWVFRYWVILMIFGSWYVFTFQVIDPLVSLVNEVRTIQKLWNLCGCFLLFFLLTRSYAGLHFYWISTWESLSFFINRDRREQDMQLVPSKYNTPW